MDTPGKSKKRKQSTAFGPAPGPKGTGFAPMPSTPPKRLASANDMAPPPPKRPKTAFQQDLGTMQHLFATGNELLSAVNPLGGQVPAARKQSFALTGTGAGTPMDIDSVPKYDDTFPRIKKGAETLAARFGTLKPDQRREEQAAAKQLAREFNADALSSGFVPPKHEANAKGLYKSVMRGAVSESQFKDKHRANAPDQDEHVSTASTYHLLQGVKAARDKISDKPTRKEFDKTMSATFVAISAARAPTQYTQFAAQTSNGDLLGTKHPTTPSAPTFSGGASGHSTSDRVRANSVSESLAISAKHTTGVVAPFMGVIGTAQVVTHNTMMGPSQASNFSPILASRTDTKSQMTARESSKQQAKRNPVFSAIAPATQQRTDPKKITRMPSPERK